jgi:pimeloyl-ACP methyl ester carboxylesterase
VTAVKRELRVAGSLQGVLTVPATPPRAGVVALHPAGGPSRDFPLLRHLADALPAHGVAVLRFDRRAPRLPDGDVSLRTQAADAVSAVGDLRAATSLDLPVILWGFSQGAWVAMIAAHQAALAGIVLVGASGVSPADQMRYTSARQVREAGFGEKAVAEMLATRGLWEDALRAGDAEGEQRALERASGRPWFAASWLPEPGEVDPDDDEFEFDFDPAPLIRSLPCPLLAVIGDDDRWVPLAESVAVLETAPDVELLHVPGGDHAPTDDGDGEAAVLPGYEAGLVDWIGRRIHPSGA